MAAAVTGTPARKGALGRWRWLIASLTVVLSSIAALAIVEVVARATGHYPRRPGDRPEPPMHEPDPTLGWKPVPGQYRFGPYSPGAAPVDVTIRADGARKSGNAPAGGRPEVLLVGCSFTMGWAVSDDGTWAWRLQELRPDVEVVNRGVGGYGTLQSLMVLEQLIGREGQRPARVLYGFIDHGWRNVAAPWWLLALSFNKHSVATPYATLDGNGGLERHPPEGYPSLPWHESLASVALLEDRLLHWRAGRRQPMAPAVTKLLIKEMADLCRAHGIGFSVVILTLPKGAKKDYERFAAKHGIDVIDCNQQLTAADSVPGEAHPNAATHRRWADCIAAALAEPQRLGEGERREAAADPP